MIYPMLYHASLFVSLASFETLAQKSPSGESYSHRGKAMRLINMSLEDPGLLQGDEIVAAILSLANFEVKPPHILVVEMPINVNWQSASWAIFLP
jgi:hypothetical protein